MEPDEQPLCANHKERCGYIFGQLIPDVGNIKMIGLKRHIVQVVDYNPSWVDLAAQACQRVLEVGADLIVDVQHVGSTAVPSLPAKPILDIAAAV